MSKESVSKVVVRLLSDPKFAASFQRDPDTTLKSFKLGKEELVALKKLQGKDLANMRVKDFVGPLAWGAIGGSAVV